MGAVGLFVGEIRGQGERGGRRRPSRPPTAGRPAALRANCRVDKKGGCRSASPLVFCRFYIVGMGARRPLSQSGGRSRCNLRLPRTKGRPFSARVQNRIKKGPNAGCTSRPPSESELPKKMPVKNTGTKQNAPHKVRCVTWERQLATGWTGRIRTCGMTESKSVALPLGDGPIKCLKL